MVCAMGADYLTKIFVKGKKSEETLVEEIMTPKAQMQTCTPKHSVHHAMSLMVEQGFRHVPVVSSYFRSKKHFSAQI